MWRAAGSGPFFLVADSLQWSLQRTFRVEKAALAPRTRSVSVIGSRVENRRSDCSLPVAIRRGFRRVASVRFGLVLFPVPAHRTGLADFPHPALGKDSRFCPRKACGPMW